MRENGAVRSIIAEATGRSLLHPTAANKLRRCFERANAAASAILMFGSRLKPLLTRIFDTVQSGGDGDHADHPPVITGSAEIFQAGRRSE